MPRPLLLALLLLAPALVHAQGEQLLTLEPTPGEGQVRYFASAPTGQPTAALVAIHGHPRDARRTFNAAVQAVAAAGAQGSTLVVAPQLQADPRYAPKCTGTGIPDLTVQELQWTCRSWVEGAPARNLGHLSSYAMLDALLAHLKQQWPTLQQVTIAGFSAGGQMVQHYIAYAAAPPTGLQVRYVVSSPSSWLYFDPQRPYPIAGCQYVNEWRYGTEDPPKWITRSPAEARAQYAAADIHYMVGALDQDAGPGTFYGILDKSCPALSQGPYRRQRAEAYVRYDNQVLAPGLKRELSVVPGCAHDVTCVFTAPAARAALLGTAQP